jgi:hypothetical protein
LIRNIGFISNAPKIAGKEGKIMGWKKDIRLFRRYKKGIIYRYTSFAPIDFRIDTFWNYLIDTYIDENTTFPRIFGHHVTYQTKEQQMPVRHFTQRLGNIFIYHIQIFLL